MPLVHRGLVNVTAQDELGTRPDKRVEDVPPTRERTFVGGAPRRVREMVVEDDDAGCSRFGLLEPSASALELRCIDGTALVVERPRGVHPDDVEPRDGGDGLGRLPDSLELGPRTHEARRCVRQVVIPRYREHRRPEPAEELRRLFELASSAAMREIARRDDELGADLLDELPECRRHLEVFMRAHVEVGHVEEACRHNRTRL
jgi:hypothetical protein